MGDIDIALLLSRWVHIMAVVVLIGGAAYARFAVIPGAKDALDDEQGKRLQEATRAKWAMFVHGGITLLLITGFLNFFILVLKPKVPAMPYHLIFGAKLMAAMFIFFLASALAGRSPGMEKFRIARRKWLGVVLALATVLILVSGLLSQIRSEHSSQSSIATPQASQAAQP